MMQRTRQATPATVLAFPQATQALEPVATTYPLSDATAPANARLGRYARVQLRDFFMSQGVTMLIVALGLIVPLWSIGRTAGTPSEVFVPLTFRLLMGGVIGIGTLLSIRGIVSDDTQKGFHRFLFSKPLDIARYYLQSLGVRFAGFLVVVAALLVPFALLGMPVAAMFASGALFFILTASVGFLLSTLSRHDIGTLIVLGAVTGMVQGAAREPLFSWITPLAMVLPPLDRLAHVVATLMLGGMPPGADFGSPLWSLLWVLAYAAASVAAGLAILRRRAVSA